MSSLTTASQPITTLMLKQLVALHRLATHFVVTYAGKCLGRAIISSVCISLLALSFSARPAAAASSAGAVDLANVDAFVSAQMQANHLPGLALGIVHDKQIVDLRGSGTADQSGRAVTPHTPFVIGSLTKSFTALAVLQLVEACKVQLEAPMQHYLPWFRLADPLASAGITVRQLLNQTSGIPASLNGLNTGEIEVRLGPLQKSLIAHECSRFLSQKWLKRYHKSSFTVFFMRFFYCLLPFLISPKLA